VHSAIRSCQYFLNYYLLKWIKCSFTGKDTLGEVCFMLGLDVSLGSYLKVVHSIPMMYMFFDVEVLLSTQYQVQLFMSPHVFYNYLCQTYCNVDFEVELCRYTVQSMQHCQRCADNCNGVQSGDQRHSTNCELLLMVCPELDDDTNYAVTQTFVSEYASVLSYRWVDSSLECENAVSSLPHDTIKRTPSTHIPSRHIIDISDVAIMYDKAIHLEMIGHFGIPYQPTPLLNSELV